MKVQGKLWLKHKRASFAEGDQRAVSYWPHLQLLQFAGEGLLWHSLCGPREAAGKSWPSSRSIKVVNVVFCFYHFFSFLSYEFKKKNFPSLIVFLLWNTVHARKTWSELLPHLEYKLSESGGFNHCFRQWMSGADSSAAWGFLQHAIPFPIQLAEHQMLHVNPPIFTLWVILTRAFARASSGEDLDTISAKEAGYEPE